MPKPSFGRNSRTAIIVVSSLLSDTRSIFWPSCEALYFTKQTNCPGWVWTASAMDASYAPKCSAVGRWFFRSRVDVVPDSPLPCAGVTPTGTFYGALHVKELQFCSKPLKPHVHAPFLRLPPILHFKKLCHLGREYGMPWRCPHHGERVLPSVDEVRAKTL